MGFMFRMPSVGVNKETKETDGKKGEASIVNRSDRSGTAEKIAKKRSE